MLVSDTDIRRLLNNGDLAIDPLDRELIQPSSIDVRLFHRFYRFTPDRRVIDPARNQDDQTYEHEVDEGDALYLEPGEFVLGSTLETVTLGSHLAGRFEGRSSLGRLGLQTHCTAGFIDPGFSGTVTLELSNVTRKPFKLYPGMRIGQLCLFRMTSPATVPYGSGAIGSRYQGQRGPTTSRSHLNWRTWNTRLGETAALR